MDCFTIHRNVWDKALLIHQNVSVCVVLGADSFAVHRNVWSRSQLLPRNASIRVSWSGASRLVTVLLRPQRGKNLVHTTIWRGNLVRTARCTSFICKIFILEKIILDGKNQLPAFFFFGISNVRIIYWENKIQNSLTPNLPWLWSNFLLGQWYHLAGLSFTKLIKLVIIVDNLPPPSPSEHLTDVTRKTYYDWLTETGSSPNKGRLVA